MSQKTQELMERLQTGVQDLFTSGKYDEYLRFLATFHSYSANNCMLIYMQCPHASLVASYTDSILAPHTYKETDENGDEHEKIGFHTASCFDVSQTFSISGEDFPVLARILTADVSNFDYLFHLLLSTSPAPVSADTIEGNINGYYDISKNLIVINKDLSESQTIKTLLHEQAHALLHGKDGEEEKADQKTREVQAESIAYVVSQYLGINTDDYSFGYVAGWSSDKTM